MKYIFSGAEVFSDKRFVRRDFEFSSAVSSQGGVVTVDSSEYFIFPGFTDVHVHFREPGFSYKETIASGCRAAAHGGYTTVFTMPNLSPTPDSLENLQVQLNLIKKTASVNVRPFGTITKGEHGKALSDMEALAPFVCGFSDDGCGVNDKSLMREAMIRAKALGKVISAHCEDSTCKKDSSESEWREVERDILLAEETGCAFHACHISTKESVNLIREAKKSGIDATAETAPHYLMLTEADCLDDGRFRMNPPLRKAADRNALLEGLSDGTIDMIATDHAPHSAEEKSRGFAGSLNGIVGLETAFPVLYTGLVRTGIIDLARLIELFSTSPCQIFGIVPDGFTVFDLNREYIIRPNDFLSMGRNTPFEGKSVFGKCLLTVCRNEIVYHNASFKLQ